MDLRINSPDQPIVVKRIVQEEAPLDEPTTPLSKLRNALTG
jgi:hypothetical protein